MESKLKDILSKTWNSNEIETLISQINGLSKSYLALKDILGNKKLKDSLAIYLVSLEDETERSTLLLRYISITSKNMLRLISDFKEQIDGIELQKQIVDSILTDNENVSYIIYNTIYNYIENLFSDKKENTSIVYLSEKNSDSSEFIEDLNISSYSQLLTHFTNFKLFKKESLSNSIIFSAILNLESSKSLNSVRALTILNKPLLYFKIYRRDIQSLYTEKKIYQELFKLVKYNVTPNILCKIALVDTLDNFYDDFVKTQFNYDIKDNIKRNMKTINKNLNIDTDDKWEETGITITQKGDIPLFELNINKNNLIEVLFQLLYTMYVFEKIEFSHNDLHFGNIFINKLDVPVNLSYKVNGKMYKLTTSLLVKVYDFDRSSIYKFTKIKVNSKEIIEIYPEKNKTVAIGVLNIFNKNIDKVKLLLPINSDLNSNEFISVFMKRVFPGLYSEKTILETYKHLLFTDENRLNNLKEANRIFGVTITDESELYKYGVTESVLNMKWKHYFEYIDKNEGSFIVKVPKVFDLNMQNSNINNLWIPDEIIFTYEKMIEQFNSINEPIDIRTSIVYTIDDRNVL
jgi:hypothetical protein